MAALQAATQDTQRLEEELGRLREGMAEEQQSSKKILAELSELKAQTREVRPYSTFADDVLPTTKHAVVVLENAESLFTRPRIHAGC